jgi:anti-sigma B factor antagonist
MADGLLDIEVRAQGDSVTLVLAGEIDLSSSSTLRACIHELDPAWRCVILDMAGVTFLDSAGVAVIHQANQDLESEYRQLRLRDLPDRVRMALEITGVLEMLTVVAPIEPESIG